MRKFFISIFMMLALCVNNSSAQVVREGNTFKQTSARASHKKDTLVTKFFYETSNGDKYPVILNKKTGSCYIWKKKKGKNEVYPMYMKPAVSSQVADEYGIAYNPRTKK